MFSLGIEFLTGNAVLTSAATREESEWPPHPARVFMALVSSHYETRPLPTDDEGAKAVWAQERQALEWLEQQGPPSLSFLLVSDEQRRTVVKQYVPVNDASLPRNPEGVKKAELREALGVMPALRSRQERTFPSTGVGLDAPDRLVYHTWPDAAMTEELHKAFASLAAKVIRIGHSSSLVHVWVAEPVLVPKATLIPKKSGSKIKTALNARIITSGSLADLDQSFNGDEISLFFSLSSEIQSATGKAKAAAKERFKSHFGEDWRASSSPPVRLRPKMEISHAYAIPDDQGPAIVESAFDSELLILTKMEGRTLGLESTNQLIEALRGTLLSGSENAPEWFTGHRARGEPATQAHLALLPLSFVSHEHADGHLLGLALAFPREITVEERAAQLSRILYDDQGQDKEIRLTLGRDLGVWTLRREDRGSPPKALISETWTEPSFVWASVTPVVLDRHPKHDQTKEYPAWRTEVIESVIASCHHIGLPTPVRVDVDKTSWHRGAPRSRPGPGGMPWLPSKNGSVRQQVHVVLEFATEVKGPVLLGAGRYRGYGVFKPLGTSGK